MSQVSGHAQTVTVRPGKDALKVCGHSWWDELAEKMGPSVTTPRPDPAEKNKTWLTRIRMSR